MEKPACPSPVAGEDRVIRADVCVIGTGAAGGMLAYRLAVAGVDVVSIEQGATIDDGYFTNELNPEHEPHWGIPRDAPWPYAPSDSYLYGNARAHDLYAREEELSSTSPQPASFVNHQIFRLNGKTNLWGGVALRYAARDFRGRDHGESDVNWPIGYDDLAPHYARVERRIGVCGTREGLAELPDGEFLPPQPLRPVDRLLVDVLPRIRDVPIRAIPNRKAVETRADHPRRCRQCGECIYGCASGSVYKFSSRLLPEIAGRPNYRLACGVKVVRLVREPSGARIAAAEAIDTATCQPVRIEARTFVVAAGALETPRLLFNSADEAFPRGLANGSGLLGCYLQDNVKAILGSALLRRMGKRETYPPGFSDGLLIPRFLFGPREFRGGYQAQFCHFLPKRPYYLDALGPLPGWAKERLAKLLFRSFAALIFFGRPEAVRANRVAPGAGRDRWGVPQVDVTYTPTENDRRMQQSMVHYGTRILRKCSGLVVSAFADPLPGQAIHYAGTCRMAGQAGEGVVDAQLRSFDHPNLYLCDGSVLPDLSEKNLTLTILALADRLGDHLVQRENDG